MEKITGNINENKVKDYFDQVTEGKTPTVEISSDEYETGIEQILSNMDEVLADAREEVAKKRMGDIPDVISFSYIAKTYFGKSRAWLMQKVNGNFVNGKQATFTAAEREKFKDALLDISNKLSAVARNF